MKHNDFWGGSSQASRTHRYPLYSEDGAEILEWTEDLEPLVRIGERQRGIGKKMHEALYGSEEEKLRKRAAYQLFVDGWHQQHPTHPYSVMTAAAAKHFGVSQKTIKRYTHNPKKS